MADSNQTDSPLDVAAGAAGPHAVGAFKQLSNEIRLAILLALWEAYDPHGDDDAVPFSELYDRVDVGDSGNFTYHLDKLTGHFVAETDDGYRLRNAGLTMVQAVIAGTGLGERTFEPTEIDLSCYHCGAQAEITYEDEHLYLLCTECDGGFGAEFTQELPAGTLSMTEFPPAGLTHRTPDEVYAAQKVASINALESYLRGVCPECSGVVDESLRICESHEAPPGEVCKSCGTRDEVKVRYGCLVCKDAGVWPVDAATHTHPAIDGFCYEQGLDLRLDAADPEACIRATQHHTNREHTLVSTDPIRIRVTVPGNDASLHLTLDGDLDVIDVDRKSG